MIRKSLSVGVSLIAVTIAMPAHAQGPGTAGSLQTTPAGQEQPPAGVTGEGATSATPAVTEQQDGPQPAATGRSGATADGDIIVTANRREQAVQDVGAAISVITADSLRAQGIVSSQDIGQLVPGVYVSGAFGGQSEQYTIRGVTQSDYLDTIESPVAYYIDDVYVTSAQGQTGGLYDVERVEVLKGPQGTLFGRNATGGLVQNVVVKPRLGETNGYAQLSYGRFNEVNGQGGINLPLGDKVAVRASGLYTRIDNFWKNIYPGGGPGNAPILSFDGPGGASVGRLLSPRGQDLGGSETYSLRGQVLFEPTDALTVRLTGNYSKARLSTAPYSQEATIAIIDAQGRVTNEQRVSPTETRLAIGPNGANYTGPVVIVPVANGVLQRPAPGGNFFGYVQVDPDRLELSEDAALGRQNTTRAQIYAGHVDYDLGGATLSSVTAYQRYYKDVYLGDGSPNNTFNFGTTSRTRSWSQEVRLNGGETGFRWQVGAFFLNNKVDLLQSILEAPGSSLANLGTVFTGIPFLVEAGNDLVTDLKFQSRSASVFGQIEYEFADRFTVIAGARYIHERQRYDYREYTAANVRDYYLDAGTIIAPSFQPDYSDRRSFDLWTGKLQLEYRPNSDLLLYAGLNRGVKAGNYNAPFTFSPADVVPANLVAYDPEKLLSIEGGFKYGSGPVTLNASVFHYDYKDFQAFVFSTASGTVRNVDSKVTGIDLEAGYRVSSALRVSANFAYQHAEIADFEVSPGILRDVRPPYSPRTQATGAIDYKVPLDLAGGDVSLNAIATYASSFYHNIRNFDSQEFDARTLVNLSASWRSRTSGLYVTIYGRNVLDRRYQQLGFDNTLNYGGQNVSYGNPATYGVTIGASF